MLPHDDEDERFLHIDNLFIFKDCSVQEIVTLFGRPGIASSKYITALAVAAANSFGRDALKTTAHFLKKRAVNSIKAGQALAHLINAETIAVQGLHHHERLQICPMLCHQNTFSLFRPLNDHPIPVNHVDNMILQFAIDTADSALKIMVTTALHTYVAGGSSPASKNRTDILHKLILSVQQDQHSLIITDEILELVNKANKEWAGILVDYPREVDEETDQSAIGRSKLAANYYSKDTIVELSMEDPMTLVDPIANLSIEDPTPRTLINKHQQSMESSTTASIEIEPSASMSIEDFETADLWMDDKDIITTNYSELDMWRVPTDKGENEKAVLEEIKEYFKGNGHGFLLRLVKANTRL